MPLIWRRIAIACGVVALLGLAPVADIGLAAPLADDPVERLHTWGEILASAAEVLGFLGVVASPPFAWWWRRRKARLKAITDRAHAAGKAEALAELKGQTADATKLSEVFADIAKVRAEMAMSGTRIRDDMEEELNLIQEAFLRTIHQHRQEIAQFVESTGTAVRGLVEEVRHYRLAGDASDTRLHERFDELLLAMSAGSVAALHVPASAQHSGPDRRARRRDDHESEVGHDG